MRTTCAHKLLCRTNIMASSNKIYSIHLHENDVPGAKFRCSEISEHSVCELKRWLECRGLITNGKNSELVKRCLECIESKATDIVVHVDGGKWYEKKVSEVLSSSRSKHPTVAVPILPTSGWNNFPSSSIPKGFCYGSIYEHIISTAKVYDVNNSDSEDNLTDFNTSKPMLKGRQFFVSGHVKNISDNVKDGHFFLKCNVMASYTQNVDYHVSLTLESPSGKVKDASCDCKASSMGRCNHVAALLFALEDYIIQFGYEPCASTSKLCTWNVGKKSKRDPKECHVSSYNKKLKADRYRNYNPLLCDIPTDDKSFINNFVATLPNTGASSMFDQILEIEYADYDVDFELLKNRRDSSISLLQHSFTSTGPYEIPNTKDQSESELWYSSRYCRITASVAKDITITHSARGKFNLLNRILWGKKLPDLKSLRYGKENEGNAFEKYERDSSLNITKSGFWVNSEYPELGCSPDGLIYDKENILKGVLEIKCPFVLAGNEPTNISNLKPSQKYNLCYSLVDGVPCLKKTHKYYYQVQMQIAICKVEYCDFVIWSPKGMSVERIFPNVEFWQNLHTKLVKFHHNTLMPEHIEMRVPRRLMPVDLEI